jgi:hypothetical protein
MAVVLSGEQKSEMEPCDAGLSVVEHGNGGVAMLEVALKDVAPRAPLRAPGAR